MTLRKIAFVNLEGGEEMKTSSTSRCLIGIFFIISGLLISAGPAAGGADSNAHYATGNNCSTHVNTPTHYYQGATYTFYLCQTASGATLWQSQILDANNNTITTCTPAPPYNQMTALGPTLQSITCTGLPLAVTVKAKVLWYVGNSPLMEHIDNFKRTR